MFGFGSNAAIAGIDTLGRYWITELDWWKSAGRALDAEIREARDAVTEGDREIGGTIKNNAKEAVKNAWKGTIHVDDECTEKGLENYRYVSEDEPDKPLRKLPTGGKEVEADALYLPGTATKIPNWHSVHINCDCDGNVIGIIVIQAGIIFNERMVEWKEGEANPPPKWPSPHHPPYNTPPPGGLPPLNPD